mgnify:CR=1 FL=1
MAKKLTEANKRLLRTVFSKENNRISSQEKRLNFQVDFKVPIRICKPKIFKNKILRKKSTNEKNQKENNNKYNFNIWFVKKIKNFIKKHNNYWVRFPA